MGSFKGLAVPLNGAATVNGVITFGSEPVFNAGISIPAGGYIAVGSSVTTAPTTGLTKGDLFVQWKTSVLPTLGICTSTSGNTIQYITAFNTSTVGRTTG